MAALLIVGGRGYIMVILLLYVKCYYDNFITFALNEFVAEATAMA